MILCGIMEYCSSQYFTSLSKANIVLESQFSVTALRVECARTLFLCRRSIVVSIQGVIPMGLSLSY